MNVRKSVSIPEGIVEKILPGGTASTTGRSLESCDFDDVQLSMNNLFVDVMWDSCRWASGLDIEFGI